MNYNALKNKMDRFFNETPVEKLKEALERKGYTFNGNSFLFDDSSECEIVYPEIDSIECKELMPYGSDETTGTNYVLAA